MRVIKRGFFDAAIKNILRVKIQVYEEGKFISSKTYII